MKIELIRKAMVVGVALLIGVSVCVSVWFVLLAHKDKPPLVYDVPSSNNGLTTENRKASQQGQDSDGEPLTFTEKAARGIKSKFMSIYTEEQLAAPAVQKMLEVMDSPEFIKYLEKGDNTYRDWHDFLESRGMPSNQAAFSKVFRDEFPAGEPEDYEPEIRLKVAEMFLVTEPVDPIDPQGAALQRARVVAELMTKEQTGRAWFIGQFGVDWDGGFQVERESIESNPALEWLVEVQRNAASIVTNAEATGSPGSNTGTSASSWDLSSVMESPPVSSDATTEESPSVSPPAIDALEPSAISKTETDAAVTPGPGLTDVPKTPTNLPTVKGLETSLKEQFSSERFNRAMSTLERYGLEEGIRRLRESDPEVAKQAERHRNRSHSEDSDKSEEEDSK